MLQGTLVDPPWSPMQHMLPEITPHNRRGHRGSMVNRKGSKRFYIIHQDQCCLNCRLGTISEEQNQWRGLCAAFFQMKWSERKKKRDEIGGHEKMWSATY